MSIGQVNKIFPRFTTLVCGPTNIDTTRIWDKVFDQIQSHHRLARYGPNLPNLTESSDELLNGPNITQEMPCPTAHPARELLPEKVEEMDLRTEEHKCVDCSQVDNHEDELINIDMLDIYALHKEPVMVEPGTMWDNQKWKANWKNSGPLLGVVLGALSRELQKSRLKTTH